MKVRRSGIHHTGAFCVSLALVLGVQSAAAQDYPNKPIRFIAPTSAGTTSDIVARVLAAEMGKILGQSTIVEDKPGAAQIIGLEYIAKQPADGYTIGLVGVDGVALLPLISKNLRFDPLVDLVPVAGVGEVRYALAGSTTRPWKTFQDMVAFARANPGKLNYGSSAPQVRFPMLVLMQDLNLDMVHVPFAGGGPYLTAIAANTIDLGVVGEGVGNSLMPRVRFYAITGKTRSAANPDVPTFTELGFPRVYGPAYSLTVRAGTPQAIMDKLTAAAEKALAMPETRAAVAKLQLDINYEKPEAAAKTLADRAKFYGEFGKKVNLSE